MVITIILCVALVGVDQLLKFLAVQFLQPVGTHEVLPGFAGLRYTENDGAAFNIFAGNQLLLIIIVAAVLVVVGYILFVRKPKGWLDRLALIFIIAGGVGNLIDRIATGFVIDYIEFQFVNFAIFNFADILVTFGFVMLVIAIILSEVKKSRKEALEQQNSNQAEENGTD